MGKRNKFTALWIYCGLLLGLMVFLTVFLGFRGRVYLTEPEGIPETVNSALNCIHTGQWEALSLFLSGNVSLQPDTGEAGSPEQILWDAFQQSLQWECEDTVSVSGSCVSQHVRITCLDVSEAVHSMTEIIKERSSQQPEEDPGLLLSAAAKNVLESNPATRSREITLPLRREQGQWKLVPDKAFLALLSGFTAA